MCLGYMQRLYHFVQGTWASKNFGIGGVLEPIPQGYRGMTVSQLFIKKNMNTHTHTHTHTHTYIYTHTYICITESLCYTPETNTTL